VAAGLVLLCAFQGVILCVYEHITWKLALVELVLAILVFLTRRNFQVKVRSTKRRVHDTHNHGKGVLDGV